MDSTQIMEDSFTQNSLVIQFFLEKKLTSFEGLFSAHCSLTNMLLSSFRVHLPHSGKP